MNYERKYKEALGWMRSLYDGLHVATKEEAEHYFHELKESEDERMRKEIIDFLRLPHPQFVGKRDHEKWIDWLEKQGEKKPIFNADDWYVSKVDGKIHNAKFIEKQCGEKPTDKVEPKFKPGDWIIFNGLILHIDEVVNGYYRTTSRGDDIHNSYDWNIDNAARLWTIQDAKDGDVLASEDKDKIFLYNGKLDLRGRACAYCGIYKTYDGLRFAKCTVGNYFTYKEPCPTTKEQRDTLFAKMADAGYEWDNEKKELKKIEPKSLNADKVIAWLKNTIYERVENYGVYNETRLILPYNSIEDLINDFKEDFRL